MKHPKEITLTEEQVDTLRSTIQILELDASLKTILTGLLDNHIWLQHELHEKKISMSRLKSYFGIKSEKHAKASSNDIKRRHLLKVIVMMAAIRVALWH